MSTQPMIETDWLKTYLSQIPLSTEVVEKMQQDIQRALNRAHTLGTQDAIEEIGKIVIWSRKQEDMVKTALGIMQYLENLLKTSLTEQEK